MNPETPSDKPGSASANIPASALAGLLNHLLKQQSWAMSRLRPYAGTAFRLRLPMLSAVLAIDYGGTLIPSETGSADITLTLNPPAWLPVPELGARFVPSGDNAEVAGKLAEILGQLRWDAEEDLSRVLGDIAAHRLIAGVDQVLAWHRKAATTIARSWVEHWQDEQPVLAKPEAVHHFFQQVDTLEDRVERLEQRIARITPGNDLKN